MADRRTGARAGARTMSRGARAAAAPAFLPGQPWRDASGAIIEAHGGGILQHAGTYYWYGEDHHRGLGNGTGIHCYASEDLLRWRDLGLALPKGELPSEYRDSGACERPKVIRSRATGWFVMWMHLDCGDGYTAAEAGVAISERPEGPFSLLRRGRPIQHDFGQQEDRWQQRVKGPTYRDMALFQDDDADYVFYAAENNQTMYVARLIPEGTWVEEPSVLGTTWNRILIGREREAPAPFKHGGVYHLLSSACTGWGPNPALHAIAAHPLGPWRELGDPCHGAEAETTYRSQPTYVLPAPGAGAGSFIYLADRWIGHALATSTYVWLPFVVGVDQRVRLDHYDRWDLAVFHGARSGALKPPRARHARGRLSWSAVPGATIYHVFDNGAHLCSTASTSCAAPRLLPGRVSGLSVRAGALGRPWSEPSAVVAVPSAPARDGWLSDFAPTSWSQGWGELRHDQSIVQSPLTIGERSFGHGLGTHGPSRITYHLGGGFRRLRALVGLNSHGKGDIQARIEGDGRPLVESRPLKEGAAPAALVADLRGVHELVLIIEPGARGHHFTHCGWCDPWLTARGA